MIGTAAALTLSRKSPSGAVILEQTCLGSSQRALRSSTNTAVLLLSRVSGFASGRFGPSCAQAPAVDAVTQRKSRAGRIAMSIFSFQQDRVDLLTQRQATDNARTARRPIRRPRRIAINELPRSRLRGIKPTVIELFLRLDSLNIELVKPSAAKLVTLVGS